MAKVAFLGLGVMGFPMAGHLAAKGHEVTVYNRTFAKAEAWTKKHKGKAARTPKEAAAGQEIVFSCVGNDEPSARGRCWATTAPSPAWPRARSSSTTPRPRPTSPASCMPTARRSASTSSMRRCRAARPGAENGQLTVMCGGEQGTVRQGQAGGRRLRQGGHADRPAGLGPDHQDDEPDVHRRASSRAWPRRSISASAPASTWTR